MILCCPVCGNSFDSNNSNEKCSYCYNDAEILLSDEDLKSISKGEIPLICEALKEKYKSEDNPKYNSAIWEVRESRIDAERERIQKEKETEKKNKFYNNLISHKTTTGYNFDDYKIIEYISVISGNVVLGTGFFTEWSASVDDFLGTTSSPYENKMEKAKDIAVQKLIRKSSMLGGNAVIGIDFDFFTVGNNMIAVSANGTSVIIEKIYKEL